MSPFLVTTKRPYSREEVQALRERGEHGPIANPRVISRRAVATLEKARESCLAIVRPWVRQFGDVTFQTSADRAILAVGDLPGTVGPLPDGTLIQVAKVSEGELGHAIGLNPGGRILAEMSTAQIVAAFNAREAGQ